MSTGVDGYCATLRSKKVRGNPQLLDKVLVETDGIVLIDEIDLHLHPSWQKRILKDLMHYMLLMKPMVRMPILYLER